MTTNPNKPLISLIVSALSGSPLPDSVKDSIWQRIEELRQEAEEIAERERIEEFLMNREACINEIASIFGIPPEYLK